MKKILYVTSSRDRRIVELTTAEYYEVAPYGIGAILYNLQQIGWENRRLALRESWNPWRVARVIEEFQPDLIYTYGVTALSPVFARRRLCRWDGPIVHGWDDYYDEIWRAAFGPLAGAFMKFWEKRIVRGSDFVITLSHYNKARAARWGKKAWYIPNGCDVPRFDPSQCPIKLTGRFNLVYSGDQAPYKRTYEVVQAMAKLPSDIKLYLTGRPYDYLQKYASENVTFLGYLSKNDMWSVIDQADVLVCTADQDCNAKFHEYLRMKKPILGYDGRPNLLFRNRETALLTKDYASAIMELCESPELRAELARNAEREIPVYTWREIAQQFDATFEEIIGLRQRRARQVPTP